MKEPVVIRMYFFIAFDEALFLIYYQSNNFLEPSPTEFEFCPVLRAKT